MKDFFLRVISKIGWHLNKEQRDNLKRIREDLSSLHYLPSLDIRYVPWTEAALRPAGVRALLNEVIIHKRQNVIEFGSGISTLYLASHFEKSESGRVVSIEHDKEWASIVESYLNDMDISAKHCQVVKAPLCPFDKAEDPSSWYDTDLLTEKLQTETFDMVFVDGPKSWQEGNAFARYPALPFVHEYLQEGTVVFLDDAEWGDQKQILQRWVKQYGLGKNFVAGMGVLRSDSSAYDIL